MLMSKRMGRRSPAERGFPGPPRGWVGRVGRGCVGSRRLDPSVSGFARGGDSAPGAARSGLHAGVSPRPRLDSGL